MSSRKRRRRERKHDGDPLPEQELAEAPPSECWVCGRPLGKRIEWHHPVPNSRGGRVTVPVHPICHRTLHVTFTNVELARMIDGGEVPADQPEMTPFLRWIDGKPPDFHAPTRSRR